AIRSFGMPLLVEYRWLRGLCTASASFSTATSGEGMSGLPNARSITSSPDRRSSVFSASTCANAYGGSALIRRNSITERLLTPSRSRIAFQGGGSSHGVGHRALADVDRHAVHRRRQ